MKRGLPPFGTVWHHPKRGGSTLLLANGCGEAADFWSSWEEGGVRTLLAMRGGWFRILGKIWQGGVSYLGANYVTHP